jgi:hypothetical protein
MRYSVALALTAVVLTVGSPALADKTSFRDRNDTKGRLDMKRFTHGHAGNGAVVHTVTMFKGFSSRLLKAPSPVKKQLRPNTVWFFFDTDRDDRAERAVAVRWNRGKLRAVVTNERGRVFGHASVSRPDRRTVKIKVKHRLLGRDEFKPYRWWPNTYYRSKNVCRSKCSDTVRGARLHH